MYLKSIEVQGFKSFANKIKFEFHNGITGIVGPNGSGKSNITDAIRWVLGEQNVRNLRGNKAEDIIFTGSSTRRPLGAAEVSVTFDNSDGKLPIDFQEVMITRRIFRSGESEFLINKTEYSDIEDYLFFINNNEKTILHAKLCIDIFAVSNCCSFAYNQRENIFAKPKGSKPIKYIVRISAVFTVSCLENAPLSKRILIIKLSKTIPIIVAILRSTNKIRDDFFIKFRAFSSFLFFIDFAIIGNKAIEVAIAKIARGS